MSEDLDERVHDCVVADDRKTLAGLLRKHPQLCTSNTNWIVGAAVLGNPGILPWLFARGVSPDCRLGCDDGNESAADTPLMIAIGYGDLSTMKVLLDNGADPDATDDLDETCFSHAIWERQSEAMRLLAEYGADVSLADETHVLWAKHTNDTAVLDVLKELGVPIPDE